MRRHYTLQIVLAGLAMAAVGCGDTEATQAGSGGVSSSPAVTAAPPTPSATPAPRPPTASPPPSDSPSYSPSQSPSESPIASPRPTTATAAGVEALTEAEARWKAKSLTSYTFTYEPSCFCPRTKLLVTVVDGSVTSVKAAAGQDEGAGSFVPAAADTPSIEKLFAELHKAYGDAKPAANVQVTYDPEFGFPTTAYIDWDELMADEETGYTVSKLAATPAVDVAGTWRPKKDNGAFVTFNADGTYTGSDGCNGASGTWSMISGKLAVTTGVHTEIGCENQPVDEWIAAADSVTIAADTMTIADGTTKRVLTRTR